MKHDNHSTKHPAKAEHNLLWKVPWISSSSFLPLVKKQRLSGLGAGPKSPLKVPAQPDQLLAPCPD